MNLFIAEGSVVFYVIFAPDCSEKGQEFRNTTHLKLEEMKKSELESILNDLRELQRQLIFARMTKDRRSRDKNIREARIAISNYAYFLPDEVKCFLYDKVDVNAMSYQYAEGDISRCISEIEDWIKSFPMDS